MSKAALTFSELAHAVGLSERSLDDHLSGRRLLPEATARRVERAIDELGYVPPAEAAVRTIGLIVPDVQTPFFSVLATEAERACLDIGADLIILPSRNRLDVELRHLQRLADGHVDGILIASNNADARALREAVAEQVGIVVLNEPVVGANAATVLCDNRKGGQLLGKHLAGLGHRKFCYIGGPKSVRSAADRGAGFRQAILPRLETRADLIECYGDYSEANGEETIFRLSREGRLPQAVFAGSDVIATGVLKAARRLQLRIPHDFSLVTFDDAAALEITNPALTTIKVALDEMARRGVELLIRTKRRDGTAIRETVGVDLIIRQSTGRPTR